MTSGIYPRKPDAKVGRKPLLNKAAAMNIREAKRIGKSTKFLSALWRVSEKTICRVLRGDGAYKGVGKCGTP